VLLEKVEEVVANVGAEVDASAVANEVVASDEVPLRDRPANDAREVGAGVCALAHVEMEGSASSGEGGDERDVDASAERSFLNDANALSPRPPAAIRRKI